MDDDDDGLLNIHLCDSDDEQSAKKRTGQSEDAFQAVKAGYRPKRQNGNLAETISLSLGPGASKLHLQDILNAVEELYFFRRYAEAVAFVEKVWSLDAGGLDDDTRNLLRIYENKCRQKMSLA